jgi:hypothetical protein
MPKKIDHWNKNRPRGGERSLCCAVRQVQKPYCVLTFGVWGSGVHESAAEKRLSPLVWT